MLKKHRLQTECLASDARRTRHTSGHRCQHTRHLSREKKRHYSSRTAGCLSGTSDCDAIGQRTFIPRSHVSNITNSSRPCHHQPFPSQTATTEHGFLFLPLSPILVHSVSLPERYAGGRGLTFTLAASWCRARVDRARLTTHRRRGQHTVCIPCSRAHFGRLTTACVSPPGDGAVSIGSHMQQDMGNSEAPPHQGAPFPCLNTVHVRKPRSTKNWR